MDNKGKRPDYIYQGGNVVMHSPLQLQRADMYGFFIKGDLAKLQRTVDTTLNDVAAGRMRFKALSPYVMLTFTRVQHANSENPVDAAKGWIPEIDIITWVMVGQMETQHGKERLARLFWYPCHVWVDNCMALINGRELYGYPKYLCEYDIPERGQDATHFSLAVSAFPRFSPQGEMTMAPLLEVDAVGAPQPERPVKDFIDLLEQAAALMKSAPDFLDLDAAGRADLVSLLLQPRVDQLFLKQFPDSAGKKAAYQAIVTAPARVDAVHSGRLLGHNYTCLLHAFDSFPLDETLGLALGEQPALLPFNLYFDFTVTEGEELVDNSRVAPEKIAILGGGVGAMTTAFYLTDQPGWQDRYDITVYQMGWRLGGKGASGRNADYGQRIEEHGLHIWFGFYENAFATIRKAYDLLERPPGAPLATWQDAFKPHNYVVLAEYIAQHWKTWGIDFPEKPGVPGDGGESLTLWDIAVSMLAWIEKWLGMLRNAHLPADADAAASARGAHPGWLHRLAQRVERDLEQVAGDITHLAGALHDFARRLPTDLAQDEAHHALLADALDGIRDWLEKRFAAALDGNDELRRLFICADLGVCILAGMLRDGVFRHGFDVINDRDFMDWLRANGANEQYTVESAPVRGFYDLVFAYEDGDFSKPNVEAGTILRAMLRIAFCYKGGLMWKMQAGMGDTIFTPFYQALKKRGVKFKFFHKVEELVPDGNAVGEIRLTRQVDLANGADHYDPFVYVKGLACWPSTPRFEQIVPAQAALLQAQDVNLESHWSDWPDLYREAFGAPLSQVTLRRGVDFDKVVLGLSIASVPVVAPKLIEKPDSPLRITTDKVKTVVTQAYQVWLTQDLKNLGWSEAPEGQEPVLSGFTEPYDTWAAMDQLLCREDWPAGADAPRNVSYFCSAMPVAGFPPPDDHGFPARCAEAAKESAIHQLNDEIRALWHDAASAGGFHWEWLVDASGASGQARFDSQYWRANVDPSERYVLSVVGSTQYRLAADGSGYANLYLAGDWIRTGLNAGCVEAATMAGMQASRAISGHPRRIEGETDF